MKKLGIVLILVLFTTSVAQASSIYVSSGSADIDVYITKYKSEADLCVYVTEYESSAKGKDGIWYFTKYSSSAKARIRFVDYKSSADLVIYYTDYQSEAGWQKSNKYTGRL